MSLRTDIHLAFDELAPATAGMPDRVVQSAARERGRRPSLSISVIRLRAPMSLVAVLLVIAIVAGILIGGLLLSQQIKGVPAGQIVGSDTLSGRAVQQHAELAFDASRPSSRANEGFIPWGLTAGVSADPSQKPISGPVTLGPSFCVGIQIDGPGFTETFALTI